VTTIALVNPAAAGVGGQGAERMRAVLAAQGVDAEVLALDLGDVENQLRASAAQKPDMLIVWGGDGTHRSALNVVGRSPSRLLLLPGGTKNFLSRSLHGAEPWEAILQAVLRTPTQRIVPAGEVNNERFFCAFLAGTPARLAQARETFRHGDVGKAVGEIGVALGEISDLHLAVRCRDRGHPEQFLPRTNLVAGLVGPLSAYRQMEVAVLPHASVVTTLDVVWTSFSSGFRNFPGIVTVPAELIEVENENDGAIPVVIDGEAISAGKMIRIHFVELGGYCLTAN
jgi:diacylglycerol kinase family enzyme